MRAPGAAAGLMTLLLAQGAVAGELDIPAQYAKAVDRANQLGQLIYLHDSAASRATDELMRRGILEKDKRLRGWLTDQVGDSDEVIVSFVGEDLRNPVVLYFLNVSGDRPPEFKSPDPAAPLDAAHRGRWLAREAAKKLLVARTDRCGESYNTVVLPAASDGSSGIRVYFLAATSQPDLMIAGGHFLYEFNADGTKLKSQRAFTRSCIDISLKADPEKGELKAITLTHLLDPTPTEIHTFLSRNYGQNIYLGTTGNSMMWIIMGGNIVAATDVSKK